ncbi:MAG: anti-sigma factor family protein [Saprospiraceae bacterium]
MENKFLLADDMLWDYADGFLDRDEKLRIDAYLRQHPEQQARLDAIMLEKRAFSALPLEKPNTGFAQEVMSAWAAEQAPSIAAAPVRTKGRDWILWAISVAFGLMIAMPFLLVPSATPSEFTLQIPEEYIPAFQVPIFDWAGFFSSALLRNTVLLTMAFIGLKLLDKYLQVRNMRLSGH